ncbi:helix-turn-helix transcriptional regulator [Nocardia sp. BMG111209]|uniref:helix-turn-helix domain-containing protein n=1 Tax=Nocardia sp. BMG111209 TaxID=1160137 RepID=UPI00035F09F0|nr:helix-turn-helix transcriptional regulator [Nocardia sp. BMG111209]
MNDMNSSPGPAMILARRQLGRFLKARRTKTGKSIKDAAAAVQLSTAWLQRAEAGRSPRTLRRQDIRALCELYGVDTADTKRAIRLAAPAVGTEVMVDIYRALEATAQQVTCWEHMVPELLHTVDYARAHLTGPIDAPGDEVLDRWMTRQDILTRVLNPVTLEVLIDQAALHREIIAPELMAIQLDRLVEVSTQPGVTVRIRPFTAGGNISTGRFVILDFDAGPSSGRLDTDEPPGVYVADSVADGRYLDDPRDVRRYRDLVTGIRRACLDERKTRDLLKRAARRYRQADARRPAAD